jgi:polysaccharide export outer membrane protein
MSKKNMSLMAFGTFAWVLSAYGGELPVTAGDQLAYRISPGDVLEIYVWTEPELQREELVGPDGTLSFPLAGELQASGKTVGQVREELTAALRPYIPDATVSPENT